MSKTDKSLKFFDELSNFSKSSKSKIDNATLKNISVPCTHCKSAVSQKKSVKSDFYTHKKKDDKKSYCKNCSSMIRLGINLENVDKSKQRKSKKINHIEINTALELQNLQELSIPNRSAPILINSNLEKHRTNTRKKKNNSKKI